MLTRIDQGTTAEIGLVLGLFNDCSEVRDALVDLRDAGFTEEQIQVAFASESERISKTDDAAASEHSFFWKLRRSWEHDLQRSGENQMVGDDSELNPDMNGLPYTQVALYKTLEALGVVADRSALLSRDVEPNGALVLVKAGVRRSEVQEILERDNGHIQGDLVPDELTIRQGCHQIG